MKKTSFMGESDRLREKDHEVNVFRNTVMR
jgi:hypothetical protein